MFVRNFLTAGSFLTLCPIGVHVTLQYDAQGRIERVFQGWDNNRKDLTSKLLDKMISDRLIPTSINIKLGTTWVQGVLYTPKKVPIEGYLPECVCDSIIDLYETGSYNFNFFAGYVDSMSNHFRGASSIRQWLTLNQFHLLPGIVVPTDFTEDKFMNLVTNVTYPFAYPLIADYILISGTSTSYHNLGLRQYLVEKTTEYVDDDGFVKYDVIGKAGNVLCSVDPNLMIKYSVKRNTMLIFEENIIYSYTTDKYNRKSIEDVISCKYCGKLITISKSSKTQCGDPHCNSRLYGPTNRLLKKLGLPTITRQEYEDVIKSVGKVYMIADILDTPQFEGVKVDCTISKVLQLVVPASALRGSDNFDLFCNRCNNSVQTVEYYLSNPDDILTDLKLTEYRQFRSFIAWLKDPENLTDIRSLLFNDHINIVSTEKAFEGVPILHNKVFYLTGTFKHGTINEVSSIIRSYSGECTQSSKNDVDAVIVGDISEDINGSAIHKYKKQGTTILTETEFFTYYDIDSDIQENLK